MGEVHRARDTQLERDVAIKILPPESVADPRARARLLREARTAAQLNHPNICTIHEVGEADGQVFIAMELVQGEPLSAKLRSGPLAADVATRYGLQLAEALAQAHQNKIVHRDLKSANIIVTPEGRVKVLDFGLAKQAAADDLEAATRSQLSLTQPGVIVGTLAYMAPEQLHGQAADARSDVWALGVVLYEMLAGRLPFRGQTGFEMSSAILQGRSEPLPANVPMEARAVVKRCLEKEPARRYQDGGELRVALEAIPGGRASALARLHYRLPRRRWLMGSVAVVVVLAIALWLSVSHLRTRFGSRPAIQSIAVLPLENLSGDPQQEYIAGGVHEALITELSRLSGLQKVTARASVLPYRNTTKAPASIASELGVDALVTGSVQRSGDRLRITAHLIDPATGKQLWSGEYDREMQDVLGTEDEIVSAITREIGLRLTPEEEQRLKSARAVNSEAYDAYLQGLFHVHRRSAAELDLASRYFEKAIAKDPGYADAYAETAQVWGNRYVQGLIPVEEAYSHIRPLVEKALQLDPDSAEAHLALADVYWVLDHDLAQGEKEYRRALDLGPNIPDVHGHFGGLLMSVRRDDEAALHLKKAIQLDPFTAIYHGSYGQLLLDQHHYDAAIAEYRKVLELNPEAPNAHRALMVAYHLKGMDKQAVAEEVVQFKRAENDPEAAAAVQAGYAAGGFRQAMHRVALVLAARSGKKYVRPDRVAALFALAGENDSAIEWLRKAAQEHSFGPGAFREPIWDGLRSDPRIPGIAGIKQQ